MVKSNYKTKIHENILHNESRDGEWGRKHLQEVPAFYYL